MVPPLIKRLVYCMYINTYVYVGMLENTTYITHWQFLPSIDIMEPICFIPDIDVINILFEL